MSKRNPYDARSFLSALVLVGSWVAATQQQMETLDLEPSRNLKAWRDRQGLYPPHYRCLSSMTQVAKYYVEFIVK